MSLVEYIYSKLPIFLQNIAVSLKGLQLQNIRKGGIYERARHQISERNNWKRDQFEIFQLKKMNEILFHARKSNPYLRKKYEEVELPLNDIKDLSKIPILTKEELREHQQLFRKSSPRANIITNTTGTTGTPISICCDRNTRQVNYAFFDSFLSSTGINPNARHIVIGGRNLIHGNPRNKIFWRYSFFQNSLLMSSYHLSPKNIPYYIAKINKYRPTYIESYPSAIFIMAQYINERKMKCSVPAIVTSAETLSSQQRESIEKAFDCSVYDQYGCAEMAIFVSQCRKSKYHIRSDYAYVEILNDKGEEVPKGEIGNIICTGLINEHFPLIRYQIGDRGAFGESCSCGLDLPTLRLIEGRKEDYLIKKDGTKIGRLSPILKELPILEAQYIQNSPGKVCIHYVPSKNFNLSTEDKIKSKVQTYLGEDMEVELQATDSLPRGKGGKVKSVISNLLN